MSNADENRHISGMERHMLLIGIHELRRQVEKLEMSGEEARVV